MKNPEHSKFFPVPSPKRKSPALHALKIDEKDPMKLPDYPRSLQFGLSASIPFGRTAGFYQTDFPGLSFGYTQAFHNDFFRKLYWLRGLAWDFTTIYSFHRTSYPITDIRLHRFQFLLGLNYVTPLRFTAEPAAPYLLGHRNIQLQLTGTTVRMRIWEVSL